MREYSVIQQYQHPISDDRSGAQILSQVYQSFNLKGPTRELARFLFATYP
jgi:hypothetical protein